MSYPHIYNPNKLVCEIRLECANNVGVHALCLMWMYAKLDTPTSTHKQRDNFFADLGSKKSKNYKKNVSV